MRKLLVYDLPTRLFHWLFALGFLSAFIIGKTVDDESITFTYHMLIGMSLAVLVLMRLIWGLIGSQHARFTHFPLKITSLVQYFKGIIGGDKKRWTGHNPASSWTAILMMLLILGLATTGFLMTQKYNKHFFEEVHELFANGFILLVVFHVAGIILHTIRHTEMIGLSMIDGKKNETEGGEKLNSTHPVAAILMFLIIAFTITYLFKNLNHQTGQLNIAGKSFQLGETEDSDNGSQNEDSEDDSDED